MNNVIAILFILYVLMSLSLWVMAGVLLFQYNIVLGCVYFLNMILMLAGTKVRVE